MYSSGDPAQQKQIADLLDQTLQPVSRKQGEAFLVFVPRFISSAEQSLQQLENTPSFAPNLLLLAHHASISETVRFSAVLYLKNFIRKKWKQVCPSIYERDLMGSLRENRI